MAQAGLFVTPMTKKKSVPYKYSPNTWRVISQDAEDAVGTRLDRKDATSASYFRNVIGQKPADLLHPTSDFRNHRPNPRSVGFLRQDVALLNEPVCDVRTRATASEQQSWWPTRGNTTQPSTPSRTLDTTARNDYQYRGEQVTFQRSRGPSCNGNSKGIVPITKMAESDKKPRFWKENISYEHQFDSRNDPQYASRGKRHGHFVWSRMTDEDVAKVTRDASPSNIRWMTSQQPRSASEHLSFSTEPAVASLPLVE